MPILNNYNFFAGEPTQRVPPKIAIGWIEDCLRRNEIDLNPLSVEKMHDNKVLIRAGGRIYFIIIASLKKKGEKKAGNQTQYYYEIEKKLGFINDSIFVDYIKENTYNHNGIFQNHIINSEKLRPILNAFWNDRALQAD